MKLSILINLLQILFVYQSIGQITICENKISNHPIDKEIFKYKDSLLNKNIDTILIYRHWESVGSFNGYGKILWIENGNTFQKKYSIEDTDKWDVVKSSEIQNLEDNTLINFYFNNNLNSITEHPKQTMIGFPQDASHFVKLINTEKEYCYEIDGLDVKFGENNLRAEWIKVLADKEVCTVKIDGELVKPKTISNSNNDKKK